MKRNEMKWKGVVAFFIVCVCMCVYMCVCMMTYLPTYLTKRTFSRLSLLFLFLYLANQSTYLPSYLLTLLFI